MIYIIQDSREKKNYFTFSSYDDVTVIRKKLDTADYSLVDFEDKIGIDRKCSSGELQVCLGTQWKRFYKELQRLSTFDEAYIMCAFPYDYLHIFPEKSEIPKYKWKYIKTCGAAIRKMIHEIEEEFPNIKFIFCDSNLEAEHQTYTLLRNYHDRKINTE